MGTTRMAGALIWQASKPFAHWSGFGRRPRAQHPVPIRSDQPGPRKLTRPIVGPHLCRGGGPPLLPRASPTIPRIRALQGMGAEAMAAKNVGQVAQ